MRATESNCHLKIQSLACDLYTSPRYKNQKTTLSGIVTSSMLSGVLDEIVGLLPVVIPVMIGFIALRKGLSFVMGMLRAA